MDTVQEKKLPFDTVLTSKYLIFAMKSSYIIFRLTKIEGTLLNNHIC